MMNGTSAFGASSFKFLYVGAGPAPRPAGCCAATETDTRSHKTKIRMSASYLLRAASLNGRRQRRPSFREDHRQQPRGLRLTGVFRDLVRRARLFIKHLPGRVRLLFALSRDFGDDRAFEDIREHEARVAMRCADAPRRVVD